MQEHTADTCTAITNTANTAIPHPNMPKPTQRAMSKHCISHR
jgi:hypothetical protein